MPNKRKLEFQKRFGQRVKQLREEREMTKTALADLMGKEIQQVQRIEAGRMNPTIFTVLEYAIALGVPPMVLLDFDVKEFYSASKKK
jgi:putative transcriptional regulator